MAIAHQSTGAVAGADSGNVTGNLPGTHGLNSILLAWAVQHDNVASTLAGYTLIAAITNGALMTLRIFAKRDNGAESAPLLTHAAGGVTHLVISSYSGIDPGLSIVTGPPWTGSIIRDLQNSTGSSATGGAFNITTPTLSGLVSGDMRICLSAHDGTDTSGGGIGADFTPSASFTERIDTGRDTATSNLSELADFLSSALATTSTSSNNEAFGATRNWIGVQLAFSSDASSTGIGPAPAFMLPLTGLVIPGQPAVSPPLGPASGSDPSAFDIITPLPVTQFVHPLSLPMATRLFPAPQPYVIPATGITFNDSGTGTITLSGTGTESQSHSISATGTITLSGTKTESQSHSSSASGTITLSGTGTQSFVATDSGSGTITLSGSFTQSWSASSSAAGTIVLSGTSSENFVPPGGATYTFVANPLLVIYLKR